MNFWLRKRRDKSAKERDAINRRLYKGLILVKTVIYRVFANAYKHLNNLG